MMVLSTRNQGKYLTKSHQRDLAEASDDRTAFTAGELDILELADDQGHLKPTEVETVPVDPAATRKRIRINRLPLYGGGED
jgi:hypothetical protein